MFLNYGNKKRAAVIVKVGRVDIKDKFTVVGSIRLQSARGDGSGGFQLGE